MDFAGRRVLVTGGTKGIGSAIVREFCAQGAEVYFSGRTVAGTAQGHFLNADFSNEISVQSLLEKVTKLKIDILINNAGINKIDSFTDISPIDFREIQKVNVEIPFRLAQTVIPSMVAAKFGRIVNIASIFSSISKEKRASYSASKFALVGWSKALAIEYAAQNVLVNTLSPGFVDTELTRKILKPEEIERLTAQVPARRLGTVEEIAKCVLFLASPTNTFITGQNILIDGGFSCV